MTVDAHSYRVRFQDGREVSFGTEDLSAVRFAWTVRGSVSEFDEDGCLVASYDYSVSPLPPG